MLGKTTLIDENVKEIFVEVDIFEFRGDQMDLVSETVWEAALILCTVMSRKIRSIDCVNILELGCGVGLSGFFVSKLALALRSSLVITLSDFDSSALKNLEITIDQNFKYFPVRKNDLDNFDAESLSSPPAVDICLESIDWLNFSFPPGDHHDDEDNVIRKHRKWIMGSALCYLPQHEALADVVHHYISRMGVDEAVIVQIRDRDGLQECLSLLTLLGMKVAVTDVSSEIFDATNAAVYCRTVEHRDDGGSDEQVRIRMRKRYLFHLPSLWGDVAPSSPLQLPESPDTGSPWSTSYRNHLLTSDRAAFVIVTVTAP